MSDDVEGISTGRPHAPRFASNRGRNQCEIRLHLTCNHVELLGRGGGIDHTASCMFIKGQFFPPYLRKFSKLALVRIFKPNIFIYSNSTSFFFSFISLRLFSVKSPGCRLFFFTWLKYHYLKIIRNKTKSFRNQNAQNLLIFKQRHFRHFTQLKKNDLQQEKFGRKCPNWNNWINLHSNLICNLKHVRIKYYTKS